MSDIEKTGSQSNPVEIKEEELSTLIKELSIKVVYGEVRFLTQKFLQLTKIYRKIYPIGLSK